MPAAFELLSFGDGGYGDEMARGLLVTLAFAVTSYALSLLCGLLLGVLALSNARPAQAFWRVYRSIFMGVPSLVVIFFFYFNLPYFAGAILGAKVQVSAFTAGLCALTAVYSAYVGEVVRGAVSNIPHGLPEAGRALGLRGVLLWRLVLLPLAWRLALPGLTNIWLILLKDTALISLIGLTDIVRVADVAAGVTRQPFLFYIAAAAVFIAFSLLTADLAKRLERRANRGYVFAAGRPALRPESS